MVVNLPLLNLPLSYTYNPLRNQVFGNLESECHEIYVWIPQSHFTTGKKITFMGKRKSCDILQNKKASICGLQDTKKERKASA